MNLPKKRQNVNKSIDESLEKYSEKDSKWTTHKVGATIVEGHYSEKFQFQSLAGRMNSCATFLGFDEVVNKITGELKIKLFSAKFCHVRSCRICAWRRSLKNCAKFMTKLPGILSKYPKPKHEWVFLTLTVPNCKGENLRETLLEMGRAWKRMIETIAFEGAFIGYVKTVEVTKELKRDGYAHPHFHILLLTSPWYFKSKSYLKQADLLRMWQEAMRDPSITQVDLRKVKPKKGQDLAGAVVETLKYGFKPADIEGDPEFLYCLTEQLHKMRFVDSGGVLKGILKDEKLTNEQMIHADDDKSQNTLEEKTGKQLFFRWTPNVKKHIRY